MWVKARQADHCSALLWGSEVSYTPRTNVLSKKLIHPDSGGIQYTKLAQALLLSQSKVSPPPS